MSRSMNKKKFLEQYVYEVEKEFDVDGTPASWAPTTTNGKPAHRFWDDEDEKIQLQFFDNGQQPSEIGNFAISHDGKLIAGSDGSMVGVFDVQTKDQCMQFRGLVLPCVKLVFRPTLDESGGYTLVIESSSRSERRTALFFLELDHNGHMTHNPDVIDVESLLQRSLEPVVSETNDSFGVPSTSPLLEPVRNGYRKALEELRASVESKDLPRVAGRTSGFGSSPFSMNGRLLLYLIQNESTQSGPRPPAELPKVIVYDVVNHSQRYELGGHEDAIMWTAFSPDGQYIATAAWDGTFRIFNVSTGDCEHIIGPTGGQCWSGAWSPDSKHILACGMTDEGEGEGSRNNTFVAVYSAETAQQVNRFKDDRLRHWVRCAAWSARGEIAIVHETIVWIWEPFSNTVVSSFQLKVEDWIMHGFAGMSHVQWAEEGKMLIVRTGHDTIEVWDRVKNIKWRLQRPEGSGIERGIGLLRWVEEDRTLRSLGKDGFMRIYQL